MAVNARACVYPIQQPIQLAPALYAHALQMSCPFPAQQLTQLRHACAHGACAAVHCCMLGQAMS